MTDHELPPRPRLVAGLDVLERTPDEVQVGLDPRHAVVVEGLSPPLADVVRGLDGGRSSATVLDSVAHPAQTERLGAALSGLTECRLVEDAGAPGQVGASIETGLWPLRIGHSQRVVAQLRANAAVTVRGSGRIAVALAALLARAGVGRIVPEAEGRVHEHDLGSGYRPEDLGRPRRAAMADAVRAACPRTQTTRPPGGRQPDLLVLTDVVVPGPEVVAELIHSSQTHLHVRVRDGTGIVGPLVAPGRSSCLRCADLHRTELDRHWPRVAAQLAGRVRPADLVHVQLTAALAAGQVLRALSPGPERPPVWNATLEIDAYDVDIRTRGWPPHPECDCGAARRPARR